MADRVHAHLFVGALAAVLLLAPAPARAGSAEAPEVLDEAGDGTVVGVIPVGLLPMLFDQVDLRAGWVNETAAELLLTIQVEASSVDLSPAVEYEFVFSFGANGTTSDAIGRGVGTLEPGGVATGVTVEGNLIVFTVPKAAVGAFRGDALGGFALSSSGTLVADPLSSAVDEAAAEAGVTYTVAQGVARGGSATDLDGDGLPDAKESQYFGGTAPQDGTGDPDGDGLNNSAEFTLGTDPTKPDTDGDSVPDGADPAPLDPAVPADGDGDGLGDAWEKENFGGTSQSGSGDPDGDGLNNTKELAFGTDPNDADTDGDGAGDADDPDPLDPDSGGAAAAEGERQPELYVGAILFAAAATFILLGLAKGI